MTWCYGFVLWFETAFSSRFCRENPVVLSTSPCKPKTHWSQTILTLKEPIALSFISGVSDTDGAVGSAVHPASKIWSRMSIARAAEHRSIDISLEITAIGRNGRKRSLPTQMFNLWVPPFFWFSWAVFQVRPFLLLCIYMYELIAMHVYLWYLATGEDVDQFIIVILNMPLHQGEFWMYLPIFEAFCKAIIKTCGAPVDEFLLSRLLLFSLMHLQCWGRKRESQWQGWRLSIAQSSSTKLDLKFACRCGIISDQLSPWSQLEGLVTNSISRTRIKNCRKNKNK